MKNNDKYESIKLSNGIRVTSINDVNSSMSMIVVVIYRGSNDDPMLYGGTHHYMEHILGSYFEYSKYGSNYDHLTMMNGSTLTNYMHIYKRYSYSDEITDMLCSNIINFIKTTELNKNILDNEKWMVNNETTSKLYDHPIMNILFIYEQIETERIFSTFGKLNSLNEDVLMELKSKLKGEDYCIYLINIPDKSVKKQINKFSKIQFPLKVRESGLELKYPKNNVLSGKHILQIKSIISIHCLIISNPDPMLLLYLLITGNETYEMKYCDKSFVIQIYQDTIVIYLSDIYILNMETDLLVKMYLEVYIKFITTIEMLEVDNDIIHLIHFYSNLISNSKYKPLLTKMSSKNIIKKKLIENLKDDINETDKYLSKKIKEKDDIIMNYNPPNINAIKLMNDFIYTFKMQTPTKVDFILAKMSNGNVFVDRHNHDTNLYYSIKPYPKILNVNYLELKNSMNNEMILKLKIDYDTSTIYSNMMTSNTRSVYLCIEIYNDVSYGYFIFYILSGCMPYYYTLYDNKKMIMNCMYQSEKKIIEDNLKSIKYNDLYNLIVKLRSGEYDIMNNRNTFFYLVHYYLNKVDLNMLYKRKQEYVLSDRMFNVSLYNYSRLVKTFTESIPINKGINSKEQYNILNSIYFKDEYIIIKNKCSDVILSQIFLQYMFTLLIRMRNIRRLYMVNFRSSFNFDYYLIMIHAQVQNIRKDIIETYEKLEDKIDDIFFNVNYNMLILNIIKLLLYYNISKFTSQVDINNFKMIKEFIHIEMMKLKKEWNIQ